MNYIILHAKLPLFIRNVTKVGFIIIFYKFVNNAPQIFILQFNKHVVFVIYL